MEVLRQGSQAIQTAIMLYSESMNTISDIRPSISRTNHRLISKLSLITCLVILLFGSGCLPITKRGLSAPEVTRTLARSFTTVFSTPSKLPSMTQTLTPTTYPTFTVVLTATPTQTPSITSMVSTSTPIKPRYVFPVQPVSAAHYLQGHHDYPAVDILAPEGTTVVAVTDGTIDFVSYTDNWNPIKDDPATRGGLSIAIIGLDGVRYYGSHLSALEAGLAPGIHVSAGTIIGKVGHTGNARSVAPHLHFGISHPTTPDDWKTRRGEIDPFQYLKFWAQGKNVTPVLQ